MGTEQRSVGGFGVFRLVRRVFEKIGPGLVTAAVVLGPGSVTACTRCGARMGYSALWVLAVSGLMMAAFTYMGAKIGMLSQESFLTLAARRYGRWAAVLAGLCGFLICVGFQTGDNVGVGIALSGMFGGSMGLWAAVFTVIALILLWGSRRVYDVLEKMMTVLVVVMIVSFLTNLLRIRVNAGEMLAGFVPGKPAEFPLVVALSATTFSVAAAAFQAYLVRSKGWKEGDVRKGWSDSGLGIFALVFISAIIMITSAAVLRPRGIKVNNALEMAGQLEPLLGSLAKWLFLSGLWAAAFSSFLVNAMVGGTLLADGLGIGRALDSFWAKMLASAVMVMGTVLAMCCGANPIDLLVLAQATTILGVPLIAILLWRLTMKQEVMGGHRNGFFLNALALIAIGWLICLSVRQALTFLGVVH